ncbi:MAG: hypothetical protein JW913_04370 [Chitinispirillaceae bacterium]|nr:hypothetical protein [Chitinispirillaceae bacterium]
MHLHRAKMLLLFFSLPCALFAQADADIDSYTNEELQGKFRTYSVFRNIGFTLLGISVATLVSGITLVSDAGELPAEGNDTTFSDKDFEQHVSGNLLIIATGLLSAIGTTFAILGACKRREYRDRMKMQGMRVGLSRERSSLEFVIDFQ